jgi:DNA (cytosine-5)-methyltransferase 1
MKPFRFIDLFAGLGGFHQAAARLGGRCVFASEILPHLRELYLENFGVRPAGDIREVDATQVPWHDLLCAGFPCQPFSKAGEQMGWEDTARGTVFWNIMEIVQRKRPRMVLLENVAHFIRHDDGNTYKKVKAALESAGYGVDFRQFSPHQFGVPQIRERIYMVAFRDGINGFHWPAAMTDQSEVSIHSVLDQNPTGAQPISEQVERCVGTWQEFLDRLPRQAKLPSFPIWAMEFGATYPFTGDSLADVSLRTLRNSRGCFGDPMSGLTREEIFDQVPSHARGASGVFPRWKQTFIRQNREFFLEHERRLRPWIKKIRQFPPSLQKLEWNCQGEERNLWRYVLQFRASGLRVKRTNTAPSLVAMTTTQIPIIAWEKRYMTPRECARLQSMDSLPHLPSGIAAMEALGNAVNVTVVENILRAMLQRTQRNSLASSAQRKTRKQTNSLEISWAA